MRELEKPVARVFRRLRYQRFLTALVWSWVITLALVAGMIAAEKLAQSFRSGAGLGAICGGRAGGHRDRGRRFAGHGPEPAGRRRRSRPSVPPERAGQFRVLAAGGSARDSRRAGGARRRPEEGGGPGHRRRVRAPAAAPGLGRLDSRDGFATPSLCPRPGSSDRSGKTSLLVDSKALAKQTELLTKKIASQRQAIDKEKFPEADKLLAQIEKKANDLAKAPPAAKDKLMVELNSLTDALKERQKQLGSPEQVKRQLQQLKDMANQGPADQFAKDLARGDFTKATEQLKKMQEKLQSGKMTEAEKKALKEQLGEMAKKLGDLANMEQRKKQLEEARKNGGLTQQQFEREMEKLQEQSKYLKQLQQLASKLDDVQKALQSGDTKKAAEAMGMTQQQMQEMAKQLEEMQSLDGASPSVADAKSGMAPMG